MQIPSHLKARTTLTLSCIRTTSVIYILQTYIYTKYLYTTDLYTILRFTKAFHCVYNWSRKSHLGERNQAGDLPNNTTMYSCRYINLYVNLAHFLCVTCGKFSSEFLAERISTWYYYYAYKYIYI